MKTLVTALLVLVAAFARGAGTPGVESIGFTVSDMDRSVKFYTRVLGFRKIGDREFQNADYDALIGEFGARVRVVDLSLGGERLELTEYRNIRGAPIPADSQSNDRWFQHVAIVVRDMDAAFRRLEKAHVAPVSPFPQRLPSWNPNAGGIRAYYFRDPDGHNLEAIWFPKGKGDSKWQTARGGLFLGIDHTAIAVASTDASLRYYRDKLGFHVAGGSHNFGVEQALLNHVQGAELRITGLRGASGPGIELLEYLRPGPGRPYPAAISPADIIHWQTQIDVAPASFETVNGTRRISDRLAPAGNVLVRDPDGHALWLHKNSGEQISPSLLTTRHP